MGAKLRSQEYSDDDVDLLFILLAQPSLCRQIAAPRQLEQLRKIIAFFGFLTAQDFLSR
jgi:hypothetical protein